MVLTSLLLQDFRNYAKQNITFTSGTTLVLGANSSGKTNLLEALWMLSLGKSFRADKDSETIRWGHEIARIQATVSDTNDKKILELVLTRGFVAGQKAPMKRFLINGIAKRMIDFAGNVPVVLFWPEHLALITDSPSLRRKYLDSVLSQVDREYRRNLGSYERGLTQRNKLLELLNEGRAGRTQLAFWDQLLIRAGSYLTQKRAAFIDFVNAHRGTSMDYAIGYDKSVISGTRLFQYAREEVAAMATLVGPHRDDFTIVTGDIKNTRVSLSAYGSRGEQRLAVLWLKLGELAFVEQTHGERPILLLDDIFSELDDAHRKLVFSLIGKQQTFITSADKDILSLLRAKTDRDTNVITLPFA
jgi:DNA replication and repair protein RecF